MGSDHGPVEEELKKKGIHNIWEGQFGVPGAETLVPLMLNAVSEGKLELNLVAKILSETPAKLYGLYPRKGSFLIGSDADFTVVDLNTSYTLRAEDMYTTCNWIPYEGRRNNGKVTHTILRGEVIMEYGEVVGEPGMGNFIPRK
jgi:dihydroorotase-like cyclic amidohydrolase